MQPPEGPNSAESEEEGELTPSPVVSAEVESVEEGELTPETVTRQKKIAVAEKERDPCKIVESKPTANTVGIEKKIEEDEPMADIKQKTDRRASVEEVKQPPTDHSKPTKDPRN